jgi:hypothetical protein
LLIKKEEEEKKLFKTSAGLKNELISLSRAIRITTNLYKILEI